MITPRFNQITLLHGRNELPNGKFPGVTEHLEAILHAAYPAVLFACPFVPSDLGAKDAFFFVRKNYVSRMQADSLLVGLERGGLIACAVQDAFPALRLSVFAANSPTEDDKLVVEPCDSHTRLALYSSAYPPIKGRCDWKALTSTAYDVPWLASGCKNLYPLAYLISAYSHGVDMDKQVAMMFPS
jgi:hypothetical protein